MNQLYKRSFKLFQPTKTGSTSVYKTLGVGKSHIPLLEKDFREFKKTYHAVTVRNPYDRFLSMYNFFSRGENLKDFCEIVYSEYKNNYHYFPQIFYTHYKGVECYDKLLRLEENFKGVEDFQIYFREGIKINHLNRSEKIIKELDTNSKCLVKSIYEEDFKLLGYEK